MKILASGFVLFFMPMVVGCGSVSVSGVQNSVDCGAVTSTFVSDVVPVFGASCTASGCHVGSSPAGGLDLGDSDASVIYANIISAKAVDKAHDPDDPLNAPLIAKPLKGLTDHDGGDIFKDLDDPDLINFYCWIKSGADEN